MGLGRNVVTLMKHPSMLGLYAHWLAATTFRSSPPVLSPYGGLKFTGWTSFSEFQFRRDGVPVEERDLMRWCLAEGRRRGSGEVVALDVGGNMGLFSLTLAGTGYDRVFVFEPVPMNSARLEKNLALNPKQSGKIKLTRAGVGEKPGVLPFVIHRNSPGTCKIATAADVGPDEERVEVPVLVLDAFCAEHGVTSVGFLKADVEGYELAVLKGADGLLARKAIAFVYLEVIHEALENAGASAAELFDYLDGHGYAPVRWTGTGLGTAITREEFVSRDAEGTRNVLWRPVG